MTLEKSEIKKKVANDIGNRLDDILEAAERDKHGYEGARQVLREAAKCLLELNAHVEKDLNEGLLNNIQDPLAVAGSLKRYVQKAVGSIENLRIRSEAALLKAEGKVEALGQAVGVTKRLFDEEDAKAKAALAYQASLEVKKATEPPLPVEGGPEATPPPAQGRTKRPTGVHPGDPLAARRKKNSSVAPAK